MKTAEAKQLLEANRERVALFISDPFQGDQILITRNPETFVQAVLIDQKVNGLTIERILQNIDTAGHFLDTLDFETYEGTGPNVVVHHQA